MVRLKIGERKRRGSLLVENLRSNEDLKGRLPRVSIDTAAAAVEGERLYQAALTAIEHQNKRRSQLADLRASLRQSHTAAWATFLDQRAIAERMIASAGLRTLLNLDTKQAHGRPGELAQMGAFYRDALGSAEAIAALSTFGITQAALEQGRAAVKAMEELINTITMVNAKKIEATRIQTQALAALDSWRQSLYKYIDIVTEDAPEVRKAVGME